MSAISPIPDSWNALRRFTSARIATGRAGGSLPTEELLRFGLDHAFARDAVHAELDLDMLEASLAPLALPIVRVATCVTDRQVYLKRPDLGRQADPQSSAQLQSHARQAGRATDIAIVIADGLSASAAQTHAPTLLLDLVPRLLQLKLTVGPLFLTRYGRVALQDDIGQKLAAQSCLILLGERPGLAAADSLGAYFVFSPRVGNTDADRNCVSNIRPAGLPIAAAAETLAYLITESLRRRLSGTSLKDERPPLEPRTRRLA